MAGGMLRKEKLRYQLNWVFLVGVTMLDGINYTAVTSTFHQFVINPRGGGGFVLENKTRVR